MSDWQTVGTRSSGGWGSGFGGARTLGSNKANGGSNAFGRREDDTSEFAARRRAHEAANAEAEATLRYREQKVKRDAEEKARSAAAAATAFDSETSYPSLGGGAASAFKPITKSTLQFKRTVADLKAREEAAELAQLAASAEQREKESWDFMPQGLRQRRFIGNRCYDDGPEDHDGPEEEDMGTDPLNDAFCEEDASDAEHEEEATNTEFNADLATTRRRGDHGVW